MAYSSSNAAYDFSAYEARPKQKKPELKVVSAPRARKATSAINARVVCAFLIVVTLISLMVYNQVQLNEVSGEINALNKQLRELDSENVQMMSMLETTLSLRSIGEQAKNELGMQSLDKFQTIYFNIEQEDKISLTEHSPGQSTGEKIKTSLTGFIARIQEYITQE